MQNGRNRKTGLVALQGIGEMAIMFDYEIKEKRKKKPGCKYYPGDRKQLRCVCVVLVCLAIRLVGDYSPGHSWRLRLLSRIAFSRALDRDCKQENQPASKFHKLFLNADIILSRIII